jgi:glutathione reductase (NADPH)
MSARMQVFSTPPVATVGLTEHECAEAYACAFDVYVCKFKTMRATLSGRDERTLMKLLVHQASDAVVGCHMVGPDAPEIMQARRLCARAASMSIA